MPETFGARLRQRREEQGIALITIAEQTKISVSLLEALERDDVSHWPSGIFRRAFIRAYALAIGLNPDVIVREFLELYPPPAEVVSPASAIASAAEGAGRNGGPPTRLRNIVGSAIGSLSRLRRSPAVENPVVATSGRVTIPGMDDVSPVHEPELAERVAEAEPVAETVAEPAPQSHAAEHATVTADSIPPNEPVARDPDLLAVARLCTRFGQVEHTTDVQPLLQHAAEILDATGLIVWVWDAVAAELRPALVHGYSDKVLAQLPAVRRDADNATAAAFRSSDARVIRGGDHTSGALVVPLLTPAGCAGVLAIELERGGEQMEPVRAVATIFAAMLAQLIGAPVEDVPQQAQTAASTDGVDCPEADRTVRPAAR